MRSQKGDQMPRNSLKAIVMLGIAALAGLTLLSTPASAGGCATSSTTLSIKAASVGWPVGVFTDIQNCSSSKQRYTVERTFTSSCGQDSLISSSRVNFTPYQWLTVSTSWYVPSGTCTGVGTVTSRVLSGSAVLSTSSAPLTIQ